MSEETAEAAGRDGGEPNDAGGYVHDPAAFDEDGPANIGETDAEPASKRTDYDDRDREFGWRGWVLVGFLLVAFFIVPAVIIALPYVTGTAAGSGLSFRDAYLVLPLIPALLLGALAVWATTRP